MLKNRLLPLFAALVVPVALAAAAAGPPAVRSTHWAFQPLRAVQPPSVKTPGVRNPIDNFVFSALAKKGVKPSPEADRPTLIRRLSFDLLGLPPTAEEVDAFVADRSPDAYEKLVDRLLASPHFGERWARHWLDLARYADSDGYEKDNVRPFAWRYRNWVIDGINSNMPFDQFTVEQIAGDLLPNATLDQKVATGFHRNTLTNTEGGVDQEEFRVKATVDRVNTTGATWLGLTVGCAQCHDHKYDPISQREYYQLFAFFNSLREQNIPAALPAEQAAYESAKRTFDDEHAKLQAEVDRDLNALEAKPEYIARRKQWEEREAANAIRWTVLKPGRAKSEQGATMTVEADGSVYVSGKNPASDLYTVSLDTSLSRITAIRLETLPDDRLPSKGPGRTPHGNFVLNDFKVDAVPKGIKGEAPIAAPRRAAADFSQEQFSPAGAIDGDAKTGWAIAPQMSRPHVIVFDTREPIDGHSGINLTVLLDQHHGQQHTIGRFRISVANLDRPAVASLVPDEIIEALTTNDTARTPEQRKLVADHFRTTDPEAVKIRERLQAHAAKAPAHPATMAQTLAEMEQSRETRIFVRGDFLRPGDPVTPATPAVLPSAASAKPGRLDFARWLVDPANPLTARVTVNRIWQNLFGRGLVSTPDDFGVRGAKPSHPELLDWLAANFAGVQTADTHAKTQRRKEGQEQITTETQRHRVVYASLTETRRKGSKGAKRQTQVVARSFPPYQGGTEGGAVAAAVSLSLNPKSQIPNPKPWDVKGLIKLIVTSATYRQSSHNRSELVSRDANNVWLARQNRFRLEAEPVRDTHLAASGLLNRAIGGPSIRPPLPADIAALGYAGSVSWAESKGADKYRRGLYIFFQRTVPYPMLVTFDTPDSNTCAAKRERSNTPLQALTLLNDPVFVECATALGKRAMEQPSASPGERIRFLFKTCLSREPTSVEAAETQRLYTSMKQLAQKGDGPAKGEDAETKAWTAVARVIMNLDEFVTRE